MKDYKLLLAGLVLLLLTVFIAIFTWLWSNNRKNADPLPVITNKSESEIIANGEGGELSSTLYIRAEEGLKEPLDDIIVSYKSRYPSVQVLASYVPANALLTVLKDNADGNSDSDVVFDTDVIIANDDLSAERLASLQAEVNSTGHQDTQRQTTVNGTHNDNPNAESDTDTIKNRNQERRTISSFNYAIKDQQALKGIILSGSHNSISFRNFLLSSTGQSILEKHNYYNINGYKNSVNDLFKPTSRAQKPSDDNPIKVADALSNGE